MSILSKGNEINTGESIDWAERRIFRSRLKQHRNSKFKFQNYPHFVSNSTSSYIRKRKLGALIFVVQKLMIPLDPKKKPKTVAFLVR
jgi:hypothetical protein